MKSFLARATSETAEISAILEPPVVTEKKSPPPLQVIAQGPNVSDLVNALIYGIDSRLAGKSATTDKALFNSYFVPYNNIGTRNPSVWCSDISDITCISPWNSHEGYARAGTLISPRHIVFANHFLIPNGATMKFVTMGDVEVSRTITNQVQIAGTDLQIAVLDSDVPGTIGFAKILPQSIYSQLIGLINSVSVSIPAIRLDQEEKATVGDTDYQSTQSGFRSPSDSKRLEFYETVITYDSGNPAFWVYKGSLIILTVWTSGGGGSGGSIHYYRNEINAAMTALGGGYQLTEIIL